MASGEMASTLLAQIGEEISHLRLGLGMTQTALGEIVGVTQQQVQRYEGGQASMTVERLVAVADALGVDPGHFFGGGGALRRLSPAQLGFGDPSIGLCCKEDLDLAAKIARIRSDKDRQDILTSIEQTVTLLLHAQGN